MTVKILYVDSVELIYSECDKQHCQIYFIWKDISEIIIDIEIYDNKGLCESGALI